MRKLPFPKAEIEEGPLHFSSNSSIHRLNSRFPSRGESDAAHCFLEPNSGGAVPKLPVVHVMWDDSMQICGGSEPTWHVNMRHGWGVSPGMGNLLWLNFTVNTSL